MRRQERINNPEKLNPTAIESTLAAGSLVIVQFSDKTYTDELLEQLNSYCLKYDENFSVRFYGHYQNSFDCKTLLKIPNVKSLWLDCLMKVDNITFLEDLYHLKRLSLGVFELQEKEILQATNFTNLEELMLGETKTKAFNLEHVKNIKNLNYLVISGHTKNIQAVSDLKNIKYLGLNSIKRIPIDFVNHLPNLKTLKLILGGRQNIDEIDENVIETLELVRVQGLNNIDNISNFKNIRNLLVEDQIKLEEINFSQNLVKLEDAKILNCKTLKSISGIEHLKKLNQLRIYKTAIEFEEFIKNNFPQSLEILAFYTNKKKIDKVIEERIKLLGYKLSRNN